MIGVAVEGTIVFELWGTIDVLVAVTSFAMGMMDVVLHESVDGGMMVLLVAVLANTIAFAGGMMDWVLGDSVSLLIGTIVLID